MTLSLYPGGAVEVEAFIRTSESALAQPAAAGATVIVVYDASRWAALQAVKIGPGDPQTSASELATIASINADGVTVTLTSALRRSHGAGRHVWRLIDATMSAIVEPPDGVDAPVTLSSVSTGRYRGSYATTQSGRHELEITASGAAAAVMSSSFDVQSDLV